MANRVRILELWPADAAELQARIRSKSAAARVVERARIVFLASHGVPAAAIAERVGCSPRCSCGGIATPGRD